MEPSAELLKKQKCELLSTSMAWKKAQLTNTQGLGSALIVVCRCLKGLSGMIQLFVRPGFTQATPSLLIQICNVLAISPYSHLLQSCFVALLDL